MDNLIHPIAELFPLIEGDEFEQLKADIKANGLREPIWLFDGLILDGRNRYKACDALGISPEFRKYTGTQPLEFVFSLNFHRRHLNEAQRAMVAAKLETYRHGGDRVSESAHLHLAPNTIGTNWYDGITRKEAADKMNVSPRSVATAAKVSTDGTTELKRAVEKGEASLHAAVALVDLPPETQREIVAAGPKAIKEAASAIRSQPATDANVHLGQAAQADSPSQDKKLAVRKAVVPVADDELEQARDAIQALSERNAELEAENKTLRMAADPEVLARIEELNTRIRTIESQRNDFQNKCNELAKEVKRLQNQLRKQNG